MAHTVASAPIIFRFDFPRKTAGDAVMGHHALEPEHAPSILNFKIALFEIRMHRTPFSLIVLSGLTAEKCIQQ